MMYCPQGHPYDEANTYVDKTSRRHCKTCRRERMAARREGTQVGYHNAKKTHCPKGHEYTDENTYRNPEGRRWCRACMAVNSAIQNIKRYGLNGQRLAEMFEAQERRCAICRESFETGNTPQIDHDHSCCPGGRSCGKCVRALLCKDCNHGLGRFKDKPENLRAAAVYLESHRETIGV